MKIKTTLKTGWKDESRQPIIFLHHPDFDSFNRMEFITAHCNPITVDISDLEDKIKYPCYPV